jgi:hypothetical protein
MILYKYVSYESGLKILRNNSIGFTIPEHFNDPFEIEAMSFDRHLISPGRNILFSAIHLIGKTQTGVLSLTRAPLNPLMWSHYCLGHSGMVIGIDAVIPEFVSEETNLLPVQYGSVIYTNERPRAPLLGKLGKLELGNTFHFQMDSLEALQRLFLFKPMCWSYEEEVRVVKCLSGIDQSSCIKSGTFSAISVAERPLYLLELPVGAIRQVYLGIRSEPLMQSKKAQFIESLAPFQPGITIFGCKISESTWNLESYSIESC